MNKGWMSTRLARRMVVLGAGCYLLAGMLLLVAVWQRTADTKAEAQSTVGPAVAVAASAVGQSRTTVDDYQVTSIGSSTAVSASIPAGTKFATVQAEDANLRWTTDGTSPTSTTGAIIYVGDTAEISASLANLELIATSGTGKANIHAEK